VPRIKAKAVLMPQPDPLLLPSKLSNSCDNVWQMLTPLSTTEVGILHLVPTCPACGSVHLWLSTRHHDCSLGRVLLTPPSNNQRATLQEHYTYGRGFAVCKQCVSAEGYQGMQQNTGGQQSLTSNSRDHEVQAARADSRCKHTPDPSISSSCR
jgi:hypothetical protein